MTVNFPFENSYATLPDRLYAKVAPVAVADPKIFALNHQLGQDLGLDGLSAADDELTQLLSGNSIAPASRPLAQLYAGHQFGGWNPQLGDGRAHLLGELRGKDGVLYDIQLKGSGQTPFSRGGDGRAWLGPVMREYLVSEAMHALGVPTTRALAAVRTGETVIRETGAMPGAILTRVARSHIRVGHFQILAARQWQSELEALYAYTVDRLAPHAQSPSDLLQFVIDKQIALITQWMGLGFIHGVMNTDNCALSGETIDYGPCAFMEGYNPATVFSAIDQMGRYAYNQQPNILIWNMAQFATALVPLMPDETRAIDEFTKIIHAMPQALEQAQNALFAQKLGLCPKAPQSVELTHEFLNMLAEMRADFTQCFACLYDDNIDAMIKTHRGFSDWDRKRCAQISDHDAAHAMMITRNPLIIPRNHIIAQVIDAGLKGDDAPFHAALEAFTQPYDTREEWAKYRQPAKETEAVTRTFCGT